MSGWDRERSIGELEAAGFTLFFYRRREQGFAIARGTVRAVATGRMLEVAEWDVRLVARKREGHARLATRRALLGPDELKALRDHIDVELDADLPRTLS